MPKNTKKGSPRYGKRYKVGKGGSHVYKIKGKRVVIGGKKKPKKPVDPYQSQVDAAVNLEFGDTDLELAKQRRVSGQASLNVGSWWSGYQRDVEAARQRTQAGYQQAQQGVYNQANVARQQDQANSGALDAEAQRQAALRGGTAGANPAAAAQASRNALSNSYGGLIGAQGAAQNAYQADQYRIGGGIRANELQKELGRSRQIDEEGRRVASKKGAYRVQTRQALISADEKARLEAAAFGLKAQSAAVDVADTQADNERQAAEAAERRRAARARERNQRRGQNVTARGQTLADQRAREKAARGGGGMGGKGKSAFTPTQIRGSRDKYLHIADVARNNPTDRKGTRHSWKWHYKNARAANRGVPPDLVKAALQRGLHGGVDPALARKIKRLYGLSVKVRKPRRRSSLTPRNKDGTPG